MEKNKGRNNYLESNRLYGSKVSRNKKWATITKELGERNISMKDIYEGKKAEGVKEVFGDNQFTLAEATILGQYLKSIYDQDTRAAEFVRDTAGEKPKVQLEVENKGNPFEGVSTEELTEFLKHSTEYFKEHNIEEDE